MNAVPSREQLFAMAAEPIGDRVRCDAGKMTAEEKAGAAKRASKVWLPWGATNKSATRESRAAQAALRETQIDLEDAIAAAGGERGSVNQ